MYDGNTCVQIQLDAWAIHKKMNGWEPRDVYQCQNIALE